MTTAHRPTIVPAKGGEEQGGMRIFVPSRMFSAKDEASHTKLKFRQPGQTSVEEQAMRDLKSELEVKEAKHFKRKAGDVFEEERKRDLALLEAAPDGGGGKAGKILVPRRDDADEEESEASDDDDDDDDDEDDEAELLAELERIKAERAEEAAKLAAERAAEEEQKTTAEVIRGNPLLLDGRQGDPSFEIKRRWDDDVVFKNQTRGEPKTQKRFINDTIRNDFHRKFLTRYIK